MKKTIFLLTMLAILAWGKKFYGDDPLAAEPKNRNIQEAQNRKLNNYYDLFSHQFANLGERHPKDGPPIRAKGVNTLGEPMDGAWWERRHYYRRMSLEELKRGPGNSNFPSMEDKWTVVSAKTEGVTPSFSIRDVKSRLYIITFDPLSNPEMATSAETIVSRIFYALGYHVQENYLVHFSPDQLVVGEGVNIPDRRGKPRQMTHEDLQLIFAQVPQRKDGKYRAIASLGLPGEPLGPPRYYGTRHDDSNDVIPHEHRRELRGLHVIDSWVDHDESRAIHNLDVLYKEGGMQHVKHFMLGFGSTLGSSTERANSARSGSYFFSWKESAKQLFTLGLVPPYWAFAKYPDYPSAGRFEWKVFDPEKWVPEYPNPAFRNRLADDEFWGAKLVTAFSDEDLRALVSTAEMSDPKAAAWLVECLAERRNKIGKYYFAKLLPFDQFQVEGEELRWVDLGAKLGYMPEAGATLQWFAFENEIEKKTMLSGQTSRRLPLVAGRPFDGYYGATITNTKTTKQSVDVYLRGQNVVGIERTW